jgi:hypothetical protein
MIVFSFVIKIKIMFTLTKTKQTKNNTNKEKNKTKMSEVKKSTPDITTRVNAAIGSGTITIASIVAMRAIENSERKKAIYQQTHGKDTKYPIYPTKPVARHVKCSQMHVHDVKQQPPSSTNRH